MTNPPQENIPSPEMEKLQYLMEHPELNTPPQDYIEEILAKFSSTPILTMSTNDGSETDGIMFSATNGVRDFIRTALQEQKEMLEKEWREKIDEINYFNIATHPALIGRRLIDLDELLSKLPPPNQEE